MTTKTLTPATKYRVAIRDIAIANDWTFTQVSPTLDRFEKGDQVVAVEHGPSNLITRAAKSVGKKQFDETPRAGKMFVVQEWLTGVADPDHQRFIRLTPEQVRKYESGQGIAKIAMAQLPAQDQAEVEEAHVIPAKEPVKAPKPRKAPTPRTASKAAPKPTARAPRQAPAAAK